MFYHVINNEFNFNVFSLNQIYSKSKSLYQRSVIIAKSSNELFDRIINQTQTKNSITLNISFKGRIQSPFFFFRPRFTIYKHIESNQLKNNNDIVFNQNISLSTKSLQESMGSYNIDLEITELKEEGVAIVGIGVRIPSGNNENSISSSIDLFDNLKNGFDGVISTSQRWSDNFNKLGEISSPNKSFDPLIFGINPSETPLIDPQQRLLLKCIWEALEDAPIDPISIRGTNTSVFIGLSNVDYLHTNKHQDSMLKNAIAQSAYAIPNRISYCFDFNGPSLSIDTACSSSSNAIAQGYHSILNGTSNLSIVGGVILILG
ncbi:hypothetical protein ACTFIV_007759 [Dictyostelium citrinum]